MRKAIPCIIMAAWISVLAIKAFSVVSQKDFDYQVILPSGWTAETRQGVRETPALVKSTFRAVERANPPVELPLSLYFQLRDKIFGGRVEYIYRRDLPEYALSVFEKPGRMSLSASAANSICDALKDELAHTKRGIAAIRECQIVTLGPTPALHVVLDAFDEKQASTQYVVSKGPNKVLLFGASEGPGAQSEIAAIELREIMRTFQVIEEQ
jgi:hypothetical protein